MVTKAFDLLQLAKRNGVHISLSDGELQVKVSKGNRIDPTLLQQLKDNKPLLTEFLQDSRWKAKKVEAYENELQPFDRSSVTYIPLSFSQERLWFIDQLEGSIAYHIPVVLKLLGSLNKEALAHALSTIVQRHEVLRSTIRQQDGQGYQYVMPADAWQLTYVDLPQAGDNSKPLKSEIDKLITLPFDLAQDFMLRAHLLQLSIEEHVLIVNIHHIASDGWSLSIIVKEVAELYNSFIEARPSALQPLPLQYADYAYWQRTWFRGEMLDKKIGYWKNKLAGVAPLALPADFERSAVQSMNGAAAGFTINKEVTDELTGLAQQHQATLFMLLMATWQVLLHRYSRQDDICVGTPVANRNYKEVEGLIGFFINTLAIRSNLSGNISFIELLQQVRKTTFEAYEHQELPFEKIVDEVAPQRDLSRSPIFQTMFVLQNTPDVPHLKLGQLQLIPEAATYNSVKFEITLSIKETPNGLAGAIEYNADLYRPETIQRMLGNFKQLLVSIITNPQQKIGLLPVLTQSEKHQLLHSFNNTQVDYPKDETIISLFEQQARQTPDAIAVSFGEEQLSYGDLNTKSTQLAHYLVEKGVKPETLVPICIERGLHMITGLLAILKAGTAYVPIDPEYPHDRIQYMLEDCKATFVLASKLSKAKLPELAGAEIIEIDGINDLLNQYPVSNIMGVCTPHSLAYIIYTSGSTGRPKGVMIEHRNVVRLFRTESPLFDFGPADVWTMFHSFCFDFSVWEMYGALLYGGRLVIVSEETARDVSQFSDLLVREKVTVLNQTPSAFYNLQDYVTENETPLHIRYVIFGGEALNVSKLQPWHQNYSNCRLINMYGITETTVHVTYIEILSQHIQAGKSVIGKPIPTLSAYILNEEQQLSPVGATGEIYIGGAGLARGYLNLPQLTAERFIGNPFTKEEGSRLYKTGDTGRWLPDGTLEYLGRIDDQVKIRGYRIELGEIENAIIQSGLVSSAVAVARQEANGNKQLVGYVVADGLFDKQHLIAYLETKLPGYMVPHLWVQIEKVPLTPNGKIDRKALPDPDISELLSNVFVAPQTQIQKDLSSIWQQLLSIESVGIYDNFFEIGGDSILTIQVVSRAGRLGYELRPKDIFIHQTIAGLSVILAERSGGQVVGEQGELTGESGLLPIQQWYLQKNNTNISHFNQSVLLGIDKAVTAVALSTVVQKIVEHHDVLRFKYYQQDETWQQEYGSAKPALVVEDMCSEAKGSLSVLITQKADAYQRSLNIEKGDVAKFVLFQTPEIEDYNRLLIVVHHLAVDGVSWRIMLADMELLLSALSDRSNAALGTKSSSYRQWYNALAQYGNSQRSLSQLNYWNEVVKNYHPLPVDTAYDNSVRANESDVFSHRLHQESTKSLLQEVPRTYHTEINDILLAALAKTLSKWSNNPQVIIGLEGHGREDIIEGIDTSRTVGWFTNLYPVLLQTAPDSTEGDVIKTVKEQLRQVPDKGIGYGVLKYIRQEPSLKGKDPWDIVFNYLGQADNIVSKSKWFSGAAEAAGALQSEEHLLTEKITINCIIRSGQLIINWTYSSRHYGEATIKKLAEDYAAALEALIAHCIQQQATAGSVHTPSDYGLGAEVSYPELDRFLDEPYQGRPRKEQVESLYRLSGLQQGMLFHSLYQQGSAAYTEQFACDIIDADLPALRQSWANLIFRHTVLRTAFYYDEFRIPVQCVYETAKLAVTILDYRTLSQEEQAAAIIHFQNEDKATGFDLKEPPLMRLALLQLSDNRYRMVWASHHILFDGWSLPVLIEELLSGYDAAIAGTQPQGQKEDRYEDYIRYIERIGKEPEEAYWRNYMNGASESTLLPFIPAMAERTKGGASYQSISLKIDAAKTTDIQRYAHKHRLTVNTIMQGVWSCLLHHYTNNTAIVYGVTVSGRPDDLPGVEQRVGLYINTLPLHSQVQNGQEVVAWLQRLQAEQVASRQYQYTPLSSIQQWAGVPGDLFDTLLIFENYPVSKLVLSKQWGLQVANVQIQEQTNYPLTLMIGSAEKIQISFEYNAQLLQEAYVKQICHHFEQVLFQITDNVAARFEDIYQLTQPEEQQLLHGFNNTQVDYPKEATFISLFETQARQTPSAIAVAFGEQQLTYEQLNSKSNQLAHCLIAKGVKENTLVPICIERGLNMIVGLLAILKAGAAYVPIDPEYPANRIAYMLEDSGATFILTSTESRARLSDTGQHTVIELEEQELMLQSYPATNPSIAVKPNQLAYVIYTSGSTGRPKGVMIEHGSLTNLLYSITDKVALNHHSSFLSVTTYSFDICYLEFYTPLINGGKLVIVPREVASDGYKLAEALAQYYPTHMQGTPATWQLLLDAGWDNEEQLQILIGGEAVSESLKNSLTPLGNVFNLYGPTETTIWSAIKKLALSEKVVIGRPLANTQMYVVNAYAQLAPVGCIGEIYIGGSGLARGYLNRPELTAERFVKNFLIKEEGARLYKTGDIGRWLPDGNIEYLGRADEQVKVRGYRIELGEIESAMMQSGLVNGAVAIAKEDKQGNKRLVAYILSEDRFQQEELLVQLRKVLPEYMVPAIFVQLQNLPLTPNGKIDRKALPDPDFSELLSHQYAAPRNVFEQQLAEIWQQLLNVKQIGIHDNFFALGGHSLLAMQIISAIRRQLQIEVSIRDLFLHPSIATLSAQLLQQEHTELLPAIEEQVRPQYIPLSFSQERLWFIHQLEGSLQYHIPTVLRLTGSVSQKALSYALQSVISRHEVLRTIFLENDGHPYQQVKSMEDWQLNMVNEVDDSTDTLALQQLIKRLISRPFDLSKDYMLKAHLIVLNSNEQILVVVMHHIASDAWSLPVIIEEVATAYSAFIQGDVTEATPLKLQYADYAIWQRNYLTPQVLDKKVNYWKAKLQGAEPLRLPTDYTRPLITGSAGGSATFRVNKAVSEKLYELSIRHGSTIFMTLLAVFKVLLHRYSGQSDISVGTSIANRGQQEVERLVGFFVNTLTFRDQVSGDASFTELLNEIKTTTLEAYEHQEVPFEKVVEAVVKDRDTGVNPLFQVMLVLGNTPALPRLTLSELILSTENYDHTISKFDLTFFITESPNGLYGQVQYRNDLFSAETIERMTGHFTQLLHSVLQNPAQKVSLLPMLTAGEQQQLLAINQLQVAYPKDATVISLFEAQVQKNPGATAVVFEGEQLTYKQLNAKAARLAHHLRQRGIQEDALVPLFIERSADMLVGMLGILKAGAAYVPIDTDFPEDRIRFMLEDTGATIVVSNSHSRQKLPASLLIEIVETDGAALVGQLEDNPEIGLQPHHLAYVIYTSGSTGNPKGVMIEHRNLVDYVYGLDEKVHISNCRSYALVSTIATDLGNTVIFSSLLFGGALHVFSKDSVSNAEALNQYFSTNEIDCLKIVPSHWKALSGDDQLLLPKKLLVFGGEALPAEYVTAIQATGTGCTIVNHYGPTETTIGKLLHIVSKDKKYGVTIPIGKPFSDTQVYVLTKALQLCPTGVWGQLYIAGSGLARGYLNNAALTNEKFIKNPFEDGSLMYATGDSVKYEADGNILFAGRIDNQIKIRGYRVELGEIETTLQQSELVQQAVITANEDGQGNKKLIGYIVPQGYFDREGITVYLKEKLPDYMIPAVLVELESLPLTANGKIDRKALPDPDSVGQLADKYVAPATEEEQKMAAIWEDILEVEQVGIHDDFFELGGHSLLAIRLISAIRKSFKAEISIGAVFDYPTVAGLITQLSQPENADVLPAITVANPRPAYIPLSFSQERLWFIDRMAGSTQYHVPTVLRLKGSLNQDALANALRQIVNRHEVLRTVVLDNQGQGYQHIKEKDAWELTVTDGAAFRQDNEGLQDYIKQLISAPFNLSADYMLRATLITISDEDHVLVATLHHIASDAWSTSIIVSELAEFYKAFIEQRTAVLPMLLVQYADFALWQRMYLQGEAWDKKLNYWQQKLEGVSPLQLPTDFTRPLVQSTNGAIVSFKIDKEIAAQLQFLSQQHGATLFMTLLAVYKVLLYRYSGQPDICVGTPVAGRQQQEVEGLIGFFINTLALRTAISGDATFTELLQQVKTNTLEAYAHQEVPFEKVVEMVVKDRDMSRSPLYQVMLSLQNTPDVEQLQLGTLQLSGEGVGAERHNTSKFDFTFFITETTHGLNLSIEYCTDLYVETTIRNLAIHFINLLQSVIHQPEQSIGRLPILTEAETNHLLTGLNQPSTAMTNSRTVVAMFEEQAVKAPDAIAVVFGNEHFTYSQLNEKANRIAHYLKEKGVQAETLVPVCMKRSTGLITAMLGILKAGGAYVPIDPAYPTDRIGFMLEDTGAKIAFADKEINGQLSSIADIEMLDVGEILSTNSYYATNLQSGITPGQLAYVIYTSGSTGRPKGVMVEHTNLSNLVNWHNEAYHVSQTSRATAMAGVGFDAFGWEVWPYLCCGASLFIVDDDVRLHPVKLMELFITNHISHSFIATALVEQFINESKNKKFSLQYLLTGGDKLSPVDAGALSYKLINNYGPTENTVVATNYEVEENDNQVAPPIGKPILNTVAYIVNEQMQLVPQGVPGELCIGGASLARGYLNRPELTAEKFIPNPFDKGAQSRLYKSGDLCRWLPDGNIAYLGRVDEQVKIRGYRVELGEVENVLQECAGVEQAVVLARQDTSGNKKLVAYVITKEAFDRAAVLAYLKTKLPDYMVPTSWVQMDTFPLTNNGKINRQALPDLDINTFSDNKYVAPGSDTEKLLATIWQEMLRVERVGIHDNFFELGGHSLMAMRMVTNIEKSLLVTVPLKVLFQFTTISELSKYMEMQAAEKPNEPSKAYKIVDV